MDSVASGIAINANPVDCCTKINQLETIWTCLTNTFEHICKILPSEIQNRIFGNGKIDPKPDYFQPNL